MKEEESWGGSEPPAQGREGPQAPCRTRAGARLTLLQGQREWCHQRHRPQQRMPVTLYVGQWEKLLGFADEIRQLMKERDAELKRKPK